MPGLGDDVQSLKAGLMEIADIFILNKSDREGADRLEQQLCAIWRLFPNATVGTLPSCAPSPRKTKESTNSPARSRSTKQHTISAPAARPRKKRHWKEWLLRLLETHDGPRARRAHEKRSSTPSRGSCRAERSLRRRRRNSRPRGIRRNPETRRPRISHPRGAVSARRRRDVRRDTQAALGKKAPPDARNRIGWR